MMASLKFDETRFWDKVEAGSLLGCWPWKAALTRGGYGQFSVVVNGRRVPRRAARIMALMAFGDSDLHVDHLCANVLCVNPWHLEFVSLKENNRRQAARRTRCPRGHNYDRIYNHPRKGPIRTCSVCAHLNYENRRGPRPTPEELFVIKRDAALKGWAHRREQVA